MKNQSRLSAAAIISASALIILFLFWYIYFKPTAEYSADWVSTLPLMNCLFNLTTSVLLVLGYAAIKRGQKSLHIKLMLSAVGSSALFLISYLLYHHFHGDTKFLGQGIARPVYFFILISHIVLSIVQLPLILFTLFHAFKKNLESHKKFAKITLPIWLYVSLTGILVYVFICQFNTM